MSKSLRERWQQLRSRFWLSLLFDVLILIAVVLMIHAWQTRNLPIDEPAPKTVLTILDSEETGSAVTAGEAGIVYFFAPWCFYCRSSIGNLQDLVEEGYVNWATVIALDYADEDELRSFIAKTGLELPVLMGNASTASNWGIRAFPTYYVIDSEGRISSRSVGYSTGLGMLVRHWLAL